MSDQEEEEETVVSEIPVYLSKALSKKLFLVQYPQRPATVSLKNVEILESKLKPTLNKLQLTLGVETESSYYDEFHGELLAEAAEGLGLNEDEYMPDTRKKIDKTTLESCANPKLTNSSRYVAGIIKDGAVHLTPLKSIVQMKTTLPFLNKADKARAKHENTGADTEDEAEEEATKVTIKFKRNQQGDPTKPTTNKSSFSARKKEDEEPWIPLKYEDNNPAVASQLCTPNTDNDVPMYVLTQKDYLSKLFPKHVDAVMDGSDTKSKIQAHQRINIQGMKELSLQDQLKVLMINGKVMHYDQILDFLKSRLRVSIDETSVLRHLQAAAVLVQGCWVVRSEIVYPDGFKSNINGIPGPVMQAARDNVLLLFTEQRFVERRKLAPLLHLPTEEVKEILSNVSKRVVKKGWEFLLPYDHSFISKYPEVVQRQHMVWEIKNQHRSRKASESNKDNLRPPTRSPPRRRHSRTMSYSSDESGTESENRARRASGGGAGGGGGSSGGGRQRRPSSRTTSESSLLGVPSRVES
ncbi:unnamed protein product [Orchesella dallaii]|uniref:DNA-directed RNA polymerase III subunit RPC5 n=1 Tax=Orchesella dallaii TaxID=48710 RepID=A0ABP1PLK4_9HEXA